MKKLFKTTRNKTFCALLGLALAMQTEAAPLGLIQSLKGHTFMTSENTLAPAKVGDSVADFSEIMTEEGAEATIALSHDQVLHLSGSTQVRFLNKMIELKRGYIWLQSPKSGGVSSIQTANADFRFGKGEGIYSFDPGHSKSQVLVLTGDHTIANINNPENYTSLRDGEFSFVSSDYEDGRARAPTRIGGDSFGRVMALFKDVSPMAPHSYEVQQNSGRSIASVEASAPKAQGKIIYVQDKSDEKREIEELKLLNYHQSRLVKMAKPKVARKWKPNYQKDSGVKVQIFGAAPSVSSGRTPASIAPTAAPAPRRSPASLGRMAPSIEDNAFNRSLVDQYKKQMRHSKEVNSLIKELESVDQDFSESY